MDDYEEIFIFVESDIINPFNLQQRKGEPMRPIDADVLKQHIDKLPALPDGNFAGNHSALKALINMQPTIESSTNCSEIQNSSDCISRQAALDVLEWKLAGKAAFDAIKSLPTAQPELITCKDCKFTDEDGPIDDGRYWCILHESFMYYCSDAERRSDG